MYDQGMCSPDDLASAGASLGEDIALLGEVAARVATRVAAGEHRLLDGVSQAALTASLLHSGAVGEACAAAVIRAAHCSGELRASGFFSVRGFLIAGVGVGAREAGRVARLGTAMERFPALRAGMLAGRMHPDAVDAAAEGITSAVADLRGAARDEARAKGEAIIAPVCEISTVAEVERAAASLIFHLDPESAARRALEAMERREVRVATVGATAVVHMVLDVLTGAQLVTVLEARVEAWFRTGSLPEDLTPTGDEIEDERRRTLARPRLLADAFAEIVAELLDRAETGSKHGAPVSVSMLVSADIHADGGPGELLVPGRSPAPVPAETVERVLCDAEVTEIHVHGVVAERSSLGQIAHTDRDVLEAPAGIHPDEHAPHTTTAAAPGDPHDLTGSCAHVHCVARRSRTATRDQRAALAARDRHCRFPSCRVDPSRCEAHHVREWERGGATCLSNLVLLCSRHHHLLHEGHWRLTADPDFDPGHPDRWRFIPPDTGYVGRDGALLAERLRRGLPPEPLGPPTPQRAAA